MSRYYLSEAYADLYNPNKVDENFYANFRFIDNLLDEDIEEVVESVYWEFRDYGNTEQEAFDLIEYALSDEVLEESLMEATVTSSVDRPKSSGSATVTSAAGRRRGRMTRVFAAKRKVERGIRSGVGAVKSAVASTGKFVSGEAQKAKAGLTKVLRTGARAAGSTLRQAGEKIEKSGQSAVASGLESRRAGRVTRGGQMALQFEPTTREKTGGLRQTIGGAIKSAGQRLFRSGAKGQVGPHGPYQQNKTASQGPKAPPAQGPRRPYPNQHALGLQTLERSGVRPVFNPASANRSARRRIGRNLAPSTPLTPWKKGPDKGGKASTSPITAKAQERNQIRLARQSQMMEEELEFLTQYILEDLINEGYADDFGSAMVILENLSDDVIEEMALPYLEY